MVNTTLIIEVIAIIFLLGIISYIAFVMFGPNNPTPGPEGKCWPGTQWDGAYKGCVSSPLTPVSKSECENGVWRETMQGGKQGICVCDKPFFGPGCDIECSDSVPCKGGMSCINGKCTSKQCKCPDGQTCSSGTKCDSCLPGRGPNFPDCTKKFFNKKLVSGSKRCIDWGHSDSTYNSFCKEHYGESSEMVGECHGNDGCGIADRIIKCSIPNGFWAYPSFNPGTFRACPGDGTKSYDAWVAAGGVAIN